MMKSALRIIYILLTPIFPFITAIREYRYIYASMTGLTPTYMQVLRCHFQSHFELIRYWDSQWEKMSKNNG